MSKETLRPVGLPLPGQHIISVRPINHHRAIHTLTQTSMHIHMHTHTPTHMHKRFSLAVLSLTPLGNWSRAVGGMLLKHPYMQGHTYTLDRLF